MAGKDLLADRLKELNKNKDKVKQDKPNVVGSIVSGKDEKPDFMKMAEVLEAEKEEKVSKLDGSTKDTIYIRDDLYKAMQSLCVKQGDKRYHVNKAYEEYLTKIYREKMKD